MLTDGSQVSIPANSTVNVIAGHPLEFLGQPSVVRLLAAADAIGLNGQFLINVGGTQLVPIAAGATLNFGGVVGQGPKDDEDTLASGVAIPPGARSQFNITNTTGAAINMRWRAVILP